MNSDLKPNLFISITDSMNKLQLFEQLEHLGFNCNRNTRYTISMLIAIKETLQTNSDVLVQLATELTNRDHLLKKNTKMYDDLQTKHKELQEICILTKERHNEADTLRETADRFARLSIKEVDAAKLKNTEYEYYVKQLNEELKEIRREYKLNRNKTKKLEKKANIPPKVIYSSETPDYAPPQYKQ